MGFPYHFVTLNEDQTSRRRQLLDDYGHFAQLSVLLIPLFLHLSLGLSFILETTWRRPGAEPKKQRQSPMTSDHKDRHFVAHQSGLSLAKIRWRLGNEIAPGWGTWNHWLFGITWTLWLLLLVVKDTGDDYLHVTRRFGTIAASQFPIHYLLALKSWSPVQFVTHMSHEELNPYHRILGRIIYVFLLCHAFLYLNFYVQLDLLLKRIQDRDVILGLCAASSATVLFTTALARVREINYTLFFALHSIISAVLAVLLHFHVSHIRWYTFEMAAVYIFIAVQRKMVQKRVPATISFVENTDLLKVSISLPRSLATTYKRPGTHAYIKFEQLKNPARINPFTIAQTPDKGDNIQMIIRPLSGTTALIRPSSNEPYHCSVTLEGPYGAAKYFPDLNKYDNILLVAGGVGATFTLPIYQHLVAAKRETGDSLNNIRFVWAVKDEVEADWGKLAVVSGDNGSLPENFQVYVTGSRKKQQSSSVLSDVGGNETIEMEERRGLLNDSETYHDDAQAQTSSGGVKTGRPPLRSLVDQFFSAASDEKVAVLVCGPRGLGGNLRNEVGRWVTTRRHIFWHSEEFGV